MAEVKLLEVKINWGCPCCSLPTTSSIKAKRVSDLMRCYDVECFMCGKKAELDLSEEEVEFY